MRPNNYALEESIYIKPYLFLENYSKKRQLPYTNMALPLAKECHKFQYRKGYASVTTPSSYSETPFLPKETLVRIPYLLHSLTVANTLASFSLPISNEEEDILLSAALLHDALEESSLLGKDGRKLVEEYGFPEDVLTIITRLTKRTGASEEELEMYFQGIRSDVNCILIKLADRAHNVEDLYNMPSIEKFYKYTRETRRWVYPLADYGELNYPAYSNAFYILKNKIVSLTESSEAIVSIYEQKIAALK